jgi:quercetin dioxygenase-like cupin family protein
VRKFVPLLIAVTSATAFSADAPPAALKRTPIAVHSLVPVQTVERVPVVRLDFQPGQLTGRHFHPMPVIGYVLEGEFIVKAEGQPEQHFSAGQSILEPANVTIERFDNASATAPAVLIAHYLAGPGQTELIHLLPPAAK